MEPGGRSFRNTWDPHEPMHCRIHQGYLIDGVNIIVCISFHSGGICCKLWRWEELALFTPSCTKLPSSVRFEFSIKKVVDGIHSRVLCGVWVCVHVQFVCVKFMPVCMQTM